MGLLEDIEVFDQLAFVFGQGNAAGFHTWLIGDDGRGRCLGLFIEIIETSLLRGRVLTVMIEDSSLIHESTNALLRSIACLSRELALGAQRSLIRFLEKKHTRRHPSIFKRVAKIAGLEKPGECA
jgi:hypothetical protein